MKNLIHLTIFIIAAFFSLAANAQETSWVQIESQPSLRAGETRARAYSSAFDNVGGFAMGGSWYAVSLGPYTREEALRTLQRLRRENLIPRDSFIADSSNFGQQFWPVGGTLIAPTPSEPGETETAETPPPEPEILVPDETRQEARQSEAALPREDRELLQIALKWEGFYESSIDGAFGRGTRRAMAAYQESQGFEPTGVLTTLQRQGLLDSYNSILDGVGLALVQNNDAGIEVKIPTDMVEFERFEPPFVHYSSRTDDGVKVLLISQEGTQTSLYGLYDIMQTLEIVPLEGERERKRNSFVLTGQNETINSYTYAGLVDGQIKGYTLIWPANDERRLGRVLREMQASFVTYEGVLDETLGAPSEDQRIDLISGLEIRKPDLNRSGFFIDAEGSVLTTSQAVDGCSQITINGEHEAEIVLRDTDLGIAVLRPTAPLSPIAFASFREGVARIQSDIAVAGYPYGGILNAPTLTFGQLADIRGLNGEETLNRLALAPRPGNAGGPVFDTAGAVIGLMLPMPENNQQLPDGVSFSAKSNAITQALLENGVNVSAAETSVNMPPERLTDLAYDITVLVSCWN